MTTDQKVAVLTRMRELLANPDRVVLDPTHYFEIENGTVREITWDEAHEKRETCRVCFCGAATIAAYEVSEDIDEDSDALDEDIREVIHAKISDLDIPLDRDVSASFGRGRVAHLTSALKQGRAVEVIDACLADLHAEGVA